MTPVYCLVERRDRISIEWELVAGIIASEVQEAEELLTSYQKENFDISEYRLQLCELAEFQAKQPVVILIAPSLKGSFA